MSEAEAPAKKRGRGRPTKYSPEVATRICDLVKVGNYFEVACANAGVDETTAYRWMARYKDFRTAVNVAQAESEAYLVTGVQTAKANWQAKAWMLERKFPRRWAARVQASVSEELHEFLTHLRAVLGPLEYRRVFQTIAARYADLDAGLGPSTAPTVTIPAQLAGAGSTPAAAAGARADGVHPPGEPAADGAASPDAPGGGDRAE